MLSEHIFYSGAIAILIGLIFYRYTGRDSSWIIILCAWAPDLDELDYFSLNHGDFHNIAFMVIFSILLAFFLLHFFSIRFFDAFVLSLIGFGVHLFEDAMVYNPYYSFLWPVSSQRFGFGLFPGALNSNGIYIRDFFGIANIQVLIIGLGVLLLAIIIRTFYERSWSWIRWYMPEKLYLKLSGKLRTLLNLRQ
jgi:hypothetical protein